MALDVKQLSCPNCGGALEIKNAQRSKSIICQFCGSQLDVTNPDYSVIDSQMRPPAVPRTPIQLGMWGSFDGKRFQAIGRVRYREDDEVFWDEWLLMTEDGEYKWLTEGMEGFTLYVSFVPTNPVDPESIDDTVNLDGIEAELDSKGVGVIDYLEGELSWKAKVGTPINYLDADGPRGQKYSIEWSDGELEFFKGQQFANNDIREAFGLEKEAARPKRGKKGGCGCLGGTIVAFIVVVIFLCIIIAMIPSDAETELDENGTPVASTSGSSGGGFFFFGGSGSGFGSGSSGGSIRSSGSSSRSSSGGGSSGGGK